MVENKCKYFNPKLKGEIDVNYFGNDVLYDKHCEATCVLRLNRYYNQDINNWPQVYIDECKYKEINNYVILLL